MKIRISGNGIRFRLGRAEVKQFGETGTIEHTTNFGPRDADKLRFVLQQTASRDFSILYESNTVLVEIPDALCATWTNTALVGFNETIDTGKGRAISMLVEKDFKCLDGTDAENEDSFPNPKQDCQEQ